MLDIGKIQICLYDLNYYGPTKSKATLKAKPEGSERESVYATLLQLHFY